MQSPYLLTFITFALWITPVNAALTPHKGLVNSMSKIPLGLYRHYKGKHYSVVGFARHSETSEEMVLYVPLYGNGGYWVRPLAMFTEDVTYEGRAVPRFTFVETGS
jgi:hypothetical protein